MGISKEVAIALALFILLTFPFLLVSIPLRFVLPTEATSANFSVYNTQWGGYSAFRELIESQAEVAGKDVEIHTIIGSLNILNRLNQTGEDAGCLIISGPALSYDTTESLALMLYILRGGRVIIADDFGTGNQLLSIFNSLLAALPPMEASALYSALGFNFNQAGGNASLQSGGEKIPFPIVGIGFNGSLLVDTQQYVKSPVQPILQPATQNVDAGGNPIYPVWNSIYPNLFDGVSSVVGNYASTLSMKVRYPLSYGEANETWVTQWVPFGWFPVDIASLIEKMFKDRLGATINYEGGVKLNIVLGYLYSSSTSYQEFNVTAARNPNNIHPDYGMEWGGLPTGFPTFFSMPLGDPNGVGTASLTLCSDPSIFVNGMIDPSKYATTAQSGNRQFTINIIDDLIMAGREKIVVYFDESHLAQTPLSPLLYLGTYFRWLDLLTMFPFIAPFFPFVVIALARKFMPKQRSAKPLLRMRVEQYYGRSYFSVKMRFFLEYQEYNRALELIYRRVRRHLSKAMSGDDPKAAVELSPEMIGSWLAKNFRDIKNPEQVAKQLTTIEYVLQTREFLAEEKFLEYYYQLKQIADRVAK